MKQQIKAICAAFGYTLVFYAGCWGLEPFLNSRDFIYEFEMMVLFAVMLPFYFFMRNHIEKRWILRGVLILSSTLLSCITWAVANGLADEGTGGSIFAYVCFFEIVHIGILLLDLLEEVLQLLVRKLRLIPLPACLSYVNPVNPNWKAFFAALLYLLFFYASPFIYEVFLEIIDRFSAPDILYDYAFCIYIGLMSLLYFSVRRHVERRWLFRGIVFLLRYCFVVLSLIFYQFISNEDDISVLVSTFIVTAFLLFDFFAELPQGVCRLFWYIKRRIQNRRA